MEELFISLLDQLYGKGYGLEFKNSCPETFDRQLKVLVEICGFHKLRKSKQGGTTKDKPQTYLD